LGLKERLLKLKQDQAVLATETAELLRQFETSDTHNENESLRRQNGEIATELDQLRQEIQRCRQEKERAITALREQIIDEKIQLTKLSRRKLEVYFADQTAPYYNQLRSLEEAVKAKLGKLRAIAGQNLYKENEGILQRINELERSLNEALVKQRSEFDNATQELTTEARAGLDVLDAQPVNEEMVQKRARQNQLEMKIGLNWLNKIGVLMILFGIGYAVQFTYNNWMTAPLKALCIFLLGGIFLVGGEWFYRRKKQIFAVGLLGGGISILYSAVFFSFFVLKPQVINLQMALFLSILVTFTALVLSLRYKSATVCGLGLAGGFLPFFTFVFKFGLAGEQMVLAMGYLFILNLLVLVLSFFMKWKPINYLSFLMNLPCMVYLCFNVAPKTAGVVYALLTFTMYLAIVLGYPLAHRVKLEGTAIFLLALNTTINCLVLYLLFEQAGWTEYRGMLALLFCLTYAGLGLLVGRIMREEQGTIALFYLTAVTFAVLMIPFQMGWSWVSTGWLIEGALLIVFGSRNRLAKMETAGWVIFLLCLGRFFLWEFWGGFTELWTVHYFDFKYAAITLGMLLVAAKYAFDFQQNQLASHTANGGALRFFKYCALINCWVYLSYSGLKLYDHWTPESIVYFDFYKMLLFAMIALFTGFVIPRIKLFADKVVRGFGICLYLLADIICLLLVLSTPILQADQAANGGADYLACGALALFNIFMILNVRDLIIRLIKTNNYSLELYPLWVAILLLANTIGWMLVQFRLGEMNLVFSLVYLVMAIIYILYGFIKRYSYIRRFGLMLALFAIGKLLLFDLAHLSLGGRILAGFSFGVILLAISFIYQKLRNRLEGQNEKAS
jgi:hypothetical protein